MAEEQLESGAVPMSVVNFLLREERMNQVVEFGESTEWLPPLFGRFRTLLEKLSQQTPNRVFYSQDGRIGRVVLFSEPQDRFQAYIEPAHMEEETAFFAKGEILASRDPEGLEDKILSWRERFSFTEDLLSEPKTIIRGVGNKKGEFQYMGLYKDETDGVEIQRPIFLGFYQSPVGIRVHEIKVGDLPSTSTLSEEFESVPQEFISQQVQSLRFHTHPFGKRHDTE